MPKEEEQVLMEKKPQLDGRFTVMPSNYRPTGKKRVSSKKMLIVVGIIILALIIIGMIVFFILSATQPPTAPQTQQPIEIPEVTQPVETEPEPEEQPEVEQPAVVAPTFVLPAVTSLRTDTDTDQDGLTDQEEAIFLTSASVPDTDDDGFLDGVEVVNLYDPAKAGALIEASPQIKISRNASQNYQFLLPLDWTTTMNTPRGEEMVIRPEDGTETLKISIIQNGDRLSARDWYQQNAASVNFSQFKNFSNEAGWVGIQSLDGTLVVATFGEEGAGARAFIFVMHYDAGQSQVIRFPSIWQMIIQSMAILVPGEKVAT